MTSAQTSRPDQTGTAPDLSVLARPSGGFAMLAVDQREAMRAMFAAHQTTPVTDDQVTRFKLAAASILTPYASGVLIDKQFAFDQAVAERVVDPACGLIAAADHFIAGPDEFVADVEIDRAVVPSEVRDQGAVALKLLVIHRPDGDPAARIAMVEEFVGRCRAAGLISIIEPVSKAPRDGREWNWDDGVLAAARELGALGADLYKAEVPLHGDGDADEIRRRCEAITEAVDSPWVVLSSGVPHELFPEAVRIACSAGASGFLAGRAIWASVIGSDDVERDLLEISVPRLERLGAVVDEALGER
ncbi:sulfofructosephosphate aldolase [Kribbella sp. VKM Ac-2527]|uniref:Sulfofructosephosphate aldolase n=1 Tax=Kribbella caucasensis TaxID=2512215 RepID=A0A4R6JI90_9ACTN|nr:aldolase [Kribbella sp. VKM Ac-2527]TDO34811.1 sulfofructosephosphate aldolase [Kribbella sp. VKM Ac-2527]